MMASFQLLADNQEETMVKQNKVFIRRRDDDHYLGNIRAVRGGLNLNSEHIYPIHSFETLIPMEIVDYYGIRLIIEYADDMEKPGQTVYDVWLTNDDDKVREYQYSDVIQCPFDAEGIQLKILEHLNNWQYFFYMLGQFVSKVKVRKAFSHPPKCNSGKEREFKARKMSND